MKKRLSKDQKSLLKKDDKASTKTNAPRKRARKPKPVVVSSDSDDVREFLLQADLEEPRKRRRVKKKVVESPPRPFKTLHPNESPSLSPNLFAELDSFTQMSASPVRMRLVHIPVDR